MKILSIAMGFFWGLIIQAQAQAPASGYYIHWNIDHTERGVKPAIKVSADEAKKIICYQVIFDKQGRFQRVRYFFGGTPSPYSNFGAHELVREYQQKTFTERFKNTQGQWVANSSGVYKRVYQLNAAGYWTKRTCEDKNGKAVAERGVARLELLRDKEHRGIAEVQYDLKGNIVPDINGFDYPYFSFTKDGLALYRQNRDKNGKVVNGKQGYATTHFVFDENGNFIHEEFRTAKGELFVPSDVHFAQINYREFDKYGKPHKVYFMDANGRPCKNKTFVMLTYRPNLSRKDIIYYNHWGNKAETKRGYAHSVLKYAKDGKFLGRENYDLQGNKLK